MNVSILHTRTGEASVQSKHRKKIIIFTYVIIEKTILHIKEHFKVNHSPPS